MEAIRRHEKNLPNIYIKLDILEVPQSTTVFDHLGEELK